ncbi:helix-turn-helix domain-containing protein [Streptomyces decoyicus]|uniref:helix-turn-helix domain-containing protein n=1 Tax=Streptomyces decoyicus TaxID=249567 RepID=UPI0036314F1A
MNPVDLLLHPARLRVVHAMSGGRALTPAQLSAQLPDISRTSLYRHIGMLAEGGVLEVEGEQRVRGAVERRYRLSKERAVIDSEAAASMSLEDHRQGFSAAMAVLLSEFGAYLDRDHADPVADSVGYRQATLWLSRDELAEMVDQMRGVLLARMDNRPAPGRTPYLVSTALFPTES